MSRIKEMVQEMEASKGLGEFEEKKRISVTGRLTEEEVFRMDIVAERLHTTRSGFAQLLLSEGILEAAESLGFDLPELQALYLSKRSKKPIEECREMLAQTGISIKEVK